MYLRFAITQHEMIRELAEIMWSTTHNRRYSEAKGQVVVRVKKQRWAYELERLSDKLKENYIVVQYSTSKPIRFKKGGLTVDTYEACYNVIVDPDHVHEAVNGSLFPVNQEGPGTLVN